MRERYFTGAYRFVPPYRGHVWSRLARPVWGWQMRRWQGVREANVTGLELLTSSVAAGSGVVLAPNHSRWADASVIGYVSALSGIFFYYLVSAHLIRGLRGAVLRRLGSIGVQREGADLAAVKECARILATAERPLVVFTEGTWTRQNERLGPIHDGLRLMIRRATAHSDRAIVVHPVAIRYRHLADATPAIDRRLGLLERRLRLPSVGPLLDRVDAVTAAVIGDTESAWGYPRSAITDQDERIAALVGQYLTDVELESRQADHSGPLLDRLRRLRLRYVRRFAESGDPRARARLDDMLRCENLLGHSRQYLYERPTLERIGEAIERLEETLDDGPERPVALLRADVTILPAINAATARTELTQELGRSLAGALCREDRHAGSLP